VKLFNDVISTVSDIINNNKYKKRPSLDVNPIRVFRDFALTKFSFERRLGPDIQHVSELLFSTNENENERGRFETIHYLSEGISKNDKNDKSGIDSLSKGLCILWIYEKYELINNICDYLITKDYNNYSIGIMHASAKLYCGSKNTESVYEIIKRIEQYSENCNNYKLWIGLSFLYFQLWAEMSQIYNIIEFLPKGRIPVQDNVLQYHKKSLFYAKKALEWLSDNKDNITEEDLIRTKFERGELIRSRTRKYFYALNIYLYYSSRGSSSTEFNDEYLEVLYDKFCTGIFDKSSWQGRFYDTLSLFNVRKSLNAPIKSEFLLYIDIAEDYNQKSSNERGITKREQDSYDFLKEKIRLIKTWGYKKMLIKKESLSKIEI
jgi:hypothetical protein